MDKISRTVLLLLLCIHLAIIPHASSRGSPSLLALNTITDDATSKKHHFVLVHGAGHGAWCWYKLVALLKSAGHSVTTIDLAACGISPVPLREVQSVQDYARPLMEVMAGSIPSGDGQKVVLVCHGLGGLPVALALEAFAEKISLAVFVAAVVFPPEYSLDESFAHPHQPSGDIYDTKIINDNGPAIIFGPKMLAHRLYQRSPSEDLELATALLRPTRLFMPGNSPNVNFTREGYGSMPRVYAMLGDDEIIDREAEREAIKAAELNEVDVIEGADHLVMMSKPEKLSDYLLRVANKFA